MISVRFALITLHLFGLIQVVSPATAQLLDFCPLIDARIVADDGQFLGRITTDTVANDSLVNPFGPHGSQVSSVSIFNQLGTYGNARNTISPFHPTSFQPPRIRRNGQTLARLTINTSFNDRVDPNGLVAWLRSGQPAMCFTPPTPTRTNTAEPTPTETPVPTDTAVPPTATQAPPTTTPTPTVTATPTDTATITPTPTNTGTPTDTRTPTPTPTLGPCFGDCNFDGRIGINDLILAVSIALGRQGIERCDNLDIDNSGNITISELIRAVRGALRGCLPLNTRTPTRPTSTPLPSDTPTPIPTQTNTSEPTATITPRGDCPGANAKSTTFRELIELSQEEIELTALAIALDVSDDRQRHGVALSLSACAQQPPGEVTFRLGGAAADNMETVAINSQCGELADVGTSFVYTLPPGSYPLTASVSGVGTVTGGTLTIGDTPLETIDTHNILSPISLIAGESEIPDLRASAMIERECSALRLDYTFVVSGLEAGITYQVRTRIDGEIDRLSPIFEAGSVSAPSTNTFFAVYQDLPIGENTVSVFIDQMNGGPALYNRASKVDVLLR